MVKVNIRRYEAPVTHRVLVELESTFCGSPVIKNPEGDTPIDTQKKNQKFDNSFEFESNAWDQ